MEVQCICIAVQLYFSLHNSALGEQSCKFRHDINPFIYCTQVFQILPKEECFFKLTCQSPFNGIVIKLIFKINTADSAGSMLFGGVIDRCTLRVL